MILRSVPIEKNYVSFAACQRKWPWDISLLVFSTKVVLRIYMVSCITTYLYYSSVYKLHCDIVKFKVAKVGIYEPERKLGELRIAAAELRAGWLRVLLLTSDVDAGWGGRWVGTDLSSRLSFGRVASARTNAPDLESTRAHTMSWESLSSRDYFTWVNIFFDK